MRLAQHTVGLSRGSRSVAASAEPPAIHPVPPGHVRIRPPLASFSLHEDAALERGNEDLVVEPTPEAVAAALPAAEPESDPEPLEVDPTVVAALATLRETYESACSGVAEVVTASRGGREHLAMTAKALDTLVEFARRPQPVPHVEVTVQPSDVHVAAAEIRQPDIHVDVHPPEITPTFEIHTPEIVLPEQAAPIVNVAAPEVTVQAAAAPDVHVDVHSPRPGPIRVEIDPETGERIFVPE